MKTYKAFQTSETHAVIKVTEGGVTAYHRQKIGAIEDDNLNWKLKVLKANAGRSSGVKPFKKDYTDKTDILATEIEKAKAKDKA